MKLSKLIEPAQKALAEHGDIEVLIGRGKDGISINFVEASEGIKEDGDPIDVIFWIMQQ